VIKAVWNGTVIAASDDTVVVDGEHYFPEASLDRQYLTFSNHRSSSWKGQARYYSLLVKGEMLSDAAWYYPEPSEGAAQLAGRVAFGKGVQVG
jgi:uncharacterized protein (DUF427 family)